ncbi:MAG: hypothetical protein SGBAC_004435 [Bacillariaceae sp.]
MKIPLALQSQLMRPKGIQNLLRLNNPSSSLLLQPRIRHNIRSLSSVAASAKPASASSNKQPTLPTSDQLRILALHSSIPMVGFGFMDNLVMITAGDFIDATFGVAFGLSTLAAAGFGQCCSDVVGVTSGGIVDATVSKLNLPRHMLSPDQLDLGISRRWSTLGACSGVLLGCLLGMSCLFFMDTDRNDKARKAKELQSIFESVMGDGAKTFNAERTTLFMLGEDNKELWSKVASGTAGIIKCPADQGIAGACVQSGEVVNIADVYKDDRFNQTVDKSTGFVTRSILAHPIKNADGVILGVIEVCNKKNEDGTPGQFNEFDERLLRMLSSHVSSFISIINDGNDG